MGHEHTESKDKILNYAFNNFDSENILKNDDTRENSIADYQFKKINKNITKLKEKDSQKIRLESYRAKDVDFSISKIVEKHRGIKKQNEQDYEIAIENEVSLRITAVEEDAIKRGYQEGVKQGREEVFNQTRAEAEEKITSLSEMIANVLRNHSEIVSNQKQDIMKMVKNLTKWIILKELKDDDKYLERLFEKLILELQSKSNLLIQVNQNNFEKMPEVLKVVQEKLGELLNVRVEVDYDIDGDGIIVESGNGIINATMDQQFKSLDKLFESIGIDES